MIMNFIITFLIGCNNLCFNVKTQRDKKYRAKKDKENKIIARRQKKDKYKNICYLIKAKNRKITLPMQNLMNIKICACGKFTRNQLNFNWE